ncbi:beta-propeller domain-containing protein [Bacillus ndiopicus]|uniref:beta-propeller domain-containing protein n=1 Tax=Bacillus ndiopicus TaxID=1347368 RepID=UPI0005A89B64|nr:beta-propeller domain-containing protein [Bacillus ndiopicus]
MKKGRTIGTIFTVAIMFIATLALFGNQKVYATTSVLEGQPFYVDFSEGIIAQASLTNGKVYVTDASGKKVNARLTLNEAANAIIVWDLSIGEYTLHVDKGAYKKLSLNNKKKSVEFNVVKAVEQIKSTKDLVTYFETVLNNQNFGHNRVQEEMMETSESRNDSVASNKSSSHSTTNNQVEGIEEGDIVVTDGRYIYSIIENELVVTDAKNPKNMKVVAKKKFKENQYLTKLILHNSLLIVAYDSYEERPLKGKDYMQSTSLSKFAFFDVKDAQNPKLVREIGQEGNSAGIRKQGDVLYMVTNSSPNYWLLREGVDVELRPYTYDSNIQNTSQPMPIEKISIFPGNTEPNYTTLSAIDLKDFAKNEVKTESYLGSGSQLYMSPEAIYVTAPKYDFVAPAASKRMVTDMMIMPAASNTQIYKFAVNQTAIKLVAQAEVKGTTLNQFSMDEYNGYFRIATTEGFAWGRNADSKNHLFILDSNLKQVGALTDLARGERIFSTRFMGDKAYLVTFKEVDPLFVIDVANPAKPKVLGELKIPGFSNYLHPLDDKHLIGIGYDTEIRMSEYTKEPFIVTKGMKLALFDVSDLAYPKEKSAVIIGGRGTYSEVQYDHKALLRHIEKGYYGFPVSLYEEKNANEMIYKGTGSQVYEVTTQGIKLKADLIEPAQSSEMYEEWDKTVRRMIYIDDALYTISQSGVVSYDLNTFEKLSTVNFTK